MSAPFNLVDRLGEGWCVTVTHGDVLEALSGMEVDPTDVHWNIDPASVAVSAAAGRAGGPVTLFARQISQDLCLVVEVDGRTGWVGAQTDVLENLSANGGMACTVTKNPNREQVLYAADGVVAVGFDPATARRWGNDPSLFDDRFAAAGFPDADGDGGSDEVLRLSPSQRAVVAMELMVGARLDASMFDGPWAGGPSTR